MCHRLKNNLSFRALQFDLKALEFGPKEFLRQGIFKQELKQ